MLLQSDTQNGLKQVSETNSFHIQSNAQEILVKKLGNNSESELCFLKDGLEDVLSYKVPTNIGVEK